MIANDVYSCSDIEIQLAGWIAEVASRDPAYVEGAEDLGLDPEDPAVQDGWIEGLVDGALERIEERAATPRRRRSPIEMMVDEACGIQILGDGTVVELARAVTP